MPTGAGKSICYQIPACAPGINGKPALVLVITPLRALMRDQVAHLSTHGIPAAFIDSETTGTERAMTYQAAREGHIRLLYVAPERLVSPEFLRFAQTLRIRLVAVDEAHCVFQWGQDFRPDYLGIAAFIEQLPERPVIAACTATATPTVREGIIQNLHLLCTGLFKYPVSKSCKTQYIDIHDTVSRMHTDQILLRLHCELFRYEHYEILQWVFF